MIFESQNDTLLLGSLRITRLSDGHLPWGPEKAVVNGPGDHAVMEEMDRLEHGKDPAHAHCLRVSCLLIETGSKTILVDTGWGRWPFASRIPEAPAVVHDLARRGYKTDDIETVVLTHAHGDHIGGNCTQGDGGLVPTYGKARYVLHQNDWDHYTEPERLANSPYHQHSLPPLQKAGVIDLIDQEIEIAPGVTILPTPGHSPGHCGLIITSGLETAYYLGDVAHHPVHLEHPEWNAMYDVLPAMARDTRRWLYERIAREHPWVIGCHFLSPGIGKLEQNGDRYLWNEISGD